MTRQKPKAPGIPKIDAASFNARLEGAVPSMIDVHVAFRIRLCRIVLGLPMTQVANQLGITWQQLAKYERARSRIGASRLYILASVFGVTPDFFFDGLQPDGMGEGASEYSEAAAVADLLSGDSRGRYSIARLIGSYWRIADAKLRKHALELVRMLADQEDQQEAGTKMQRFTPG